MKITVGQKAYKKGDYVPTLLKAGDTIDLGRWVLNALPCEFCRDPTSLIFLDKTYRTTV